MTSSPKPAPQLIRERLRLLVRGAPPPNAKRTPEDVIARAREEVAEIVAGDGPVIAGPWLGEVGYELLYWIPFLRWATREHPGLRERLIAVSRGGVESWYGDVASRYAEIFELATLEELVAWRAEPQIADEDEAEPGVLAMTPRKARRVTPGDTTLVGRAAERSGIAGYRLLHPSVYFKLMYRLRKLGAWSAVDHVSQFARIDPPTDEIELPERFVAVRFYSSGALPATHENRELVTSILESIGAQLPLVDIDTGLREDDHDALSTAIPTAVQLRDLGVPPARNLGLQTAAIARADAFVGTYGGLSYLAPLLGVPSLALYVDPTAFFHYHLARADRQFTGESWGGFAAINVGGPRVRELLLDGLHRRTSPA